MMISTFESCLPGKSIQKKGLLKRALLPCLALLLLASCATRMRLPEDLDPERLLPTGAMAYLRVNPVMVEGLILPLVEPYGIAQTAELIKRTESMVLAVMPPVDPPEGQTDRPVVYGVASGEFPTRSIALKLNTDRRWAKEAPGWIHKAEGFRVALTSRGQIIIGTAPLGMFSSGEHQGSHPIPRIWSTAWDNDLAIYLPDPFVLLGNSLPIDTSGLPLESMMVSTRRVAEHFDLYIGFEFATERAAMVFAPLCRLFLYALARSLWPAQASEILASVSWSSTGFTVGASGVRLDVSQLYSLLTLPFGTMIQAPIGLAGGAR